MTPDAVIAEARSYLGVPFRHQGRDRNGIDCAGLVLVVGQTLRLFPRTLSLASYSRLPSGELMQRVQEHCRPLAAPRPGSVVIIAWTQVAAHVALCTGPTLIHAYQNVGCVVEHGYRGRWLKLTHSVWALPGVDYE